MNKIRLQGLAVLAMFLLGLPNTHAIGPISQQAYLKPAAVGAIQAFDKFGTAVAISGDTMIIGAPEEDSSTTGVNSTPNESAAESGAAYVFVRSGTNWVQQAYLKPASVGATQAGDRFGYSVAISGDTLIVGAFTEDSSTTGVNSTPDESAQNSGAVYVFVRSGTNWTQQAYLKPAAVGSRQTEDWFGYSVAIWGDTVVVGARNEGSSTTGVNSTPNESARESGAAYIFVRSGTNWTQQAYLKPSSSQPFGYFGNAVAISGNSVAVGANSFASDYGAAYVFVRSGTNWTQQTALTSGIHSRSNFGYSVGIWDDTMVVGALGEEAAYVFVRTQTNWSLQSYLKAPGGVDNFLRDRFGSSVGISGDTVIVGAPYEDSATLGVNSTPDENAPYAGAAYVFARSGTTWTQRAYVKPAAVGSSQLNDDFGIAVAVWGDTVVVGADGETSGTTGINSTPDESGGYYAGAAYVLVRDTEPPIFTSCPTDILLSVSPPSDSAAAFFNPVAEDNTGTNGLVITCVPPSGSAFPIGTNNVVCTATDAAGNQAECRFQVVVQVDMLGARGLKQGVLAELTSLRAGVTKKKDRKNLDDAINHLAKSLDSDLWMDHAHLNSKHGERVFDEEKEAVEELLDALDRRSTTLSAVVVQDLIDRMVRADRLLAATAIADAKAAAGETKRLREAQREFAKGEAEAADGDAEKAIEHYAHAWHDAIRVKPTKLLRAPDGRTQLQFMGEPRQRYAVQCSPDLKTWTTLDTRTADADGLIEYDDVEAGKFPARFYRLATP